MVGHKINENGIDSNEEKVEAILQLKPPENTRELKSLLGSIQCMAKFLPKVSERTDRLKTLLKKMNHEYGKMNTKKISER